MPMSYVFAYWVLAVIIVGIITWWAGRIIVSELADRKDAKLREANWRAMERIFSQPTAVINGIAVDMEATGVIGTLTLPPRTFDEVGKDYAYALAESMGFHDYRFPTVVVQSRARETRFAGNNLFTQPTQYIPEQMADNRRPNGNARQNAYDAIPNDCGTYLARVGGGYPTGGGTFIPIEGN